MLVPYESQFQAWNLVEVAVYVPQLNAVIRQKNGEDSIFLEWGEELIDFRNAHNSEGVYTSALRFREKTFDTPRLGCIYFDFDDEPDPTKALHDARKVYSYLTEVVDQQHVRTYFTGAKGFHIEVEPIPVGVTPLTSLPDVYRHIAENLAVRLDLPTMDMAVYDSRRMWRLANTRNQKTGLYKIELADDFFTLGDIDQMKMYASKPRPRITPTHLDFNTQANAWYKDQIVEYEERIEEERVRIARKKAELFNTYGTSLARKTSQKKMHKIWDAAIESLRSTEANKNRNNTLSKEAYAVFLTALEGDYDPDDYTIPLLEVAMAIGLHEREAKATIRSAMRAATMKFESIPRQLV